MATRRQLAKGKYAIDRKINPAASDIETHYIGIKAEWAVGRYLGMFPDLHAYAGGDGGVDLVYNGWTLDVKATRDWLVFNSLDHFRSDIAVVVSPHGAARDPFVGEHKTHWRRDVVIRGWTTRNQFEQAAHKKDLGYGPRLVMYAEDLNPVITLQSIPIFSGA